MPRTAGRHLEGRMPTPHRTPTAAPARSIPALVAGLLLAPALLAAQVPVTDDLSGPLREGAVAYHDGDFAGAIRAFDRVLATDSLNVQANWRAALALIDLVGEVPVSTPNAARDSSFARAEVLAVRAVRADPRSAWAWFTLANALGRTSLTKGPRERLDRARDIRAAALRAIALDPTHDGAYHVLGRWHQEMMKVSGVNRFFARQLLGAKVFDEASWEGAETNLEKAVQLKPTRIIHRLDLARVYADRKRWADARAQLAEIRRLPDGDARDPEYRRLADELATELARHR